MFNCRNYIICDNNVDTVNELCFDCNMLFGSWRGCKNISNNKQDIGTLCFKNDICIRRPKCEHYICKQCFKKLYFASGMYIIKGCLKDKGNQEALLSEYIDFENSCKKCFECDK